MTATDRSNDPASARRTGACAATLAALLCALAASAPPAADARATTPSALPAFRSCTALLSFARSGARRSGGGVGVPTRAGMLGVEALEAPGRVGADGFVPPSAASPAPAAAEGTANATPSFSSTNVQEAGVDEPDVVKTDGRRVFAIADGTLRAIDVTGDAPKLVGSLELAGSGAPQMLLRGDRLLVMTTTYGFGPGPGPIPLGAGVAGGTAEIAYGHSTVMLSEIDVSDPAAMVVRRTMRLDGALVDARLTGSTARVVVASSPGIVAPAAIRSTSVRHFVPRTTLHSYVSRRTFRRSVVPCHDVRHPRAFSGLDLLTVLTIDLDKGLFDVDRDAILAGAQTVYGSPTSLYVASQRYSPAVEDGRSLPATAHTEIDRFDASQPGETSYAGSGEVSGYVLNQYAMSEYDGALRVASTDEPAWFDGTLARDSESSVTVLDTSGRTFTQLGRVGGLGRGQRIYAVRFVGDKAYVVTFRQVDPLYTLDLSDNAHPRVLGELELLGYSAYLHPISDDLLLGVGVDAGADGSRLGTQLSLFDVSDLRHPVRRALASLGAGSTTTAEFDPHAFLFWKPASLAVVPLSVYGASGVTFQGAVGFRVGTDSLAEAGRVVHPPAPGGQGDPPAIARALVVGDTLYTLSYAGLQASALGDLAPRAFVAFPAPPQPPPPPQPVQPPQSAPAQAVAATG